MWSSSNQSCPIWVVVHITRNQPSAGRAELSSLVKDVTDVGYFSSGLSGSFEPAAPVAQFLTTTQF